MAQGIVLHIIPNIYEAEISRTMRASVQWRQQGCCRSVLVLPRSHWFGHPCRQWRAWCPQNIWLYTGWRRGADRSASVIRSRCSSSNSLLWPSSHMSYWIDIYRRWHSSTGRKAMLCEGPLYTQLMSPLHLLTR